MTDISRRLFVTRAAAFIAAPAIVRVTSLMPVTPWLDTINFGPGYIITQQELVERAYFVCEEAVFFSSGNVRPQQIPGAPVWAYDHLRQIWTQ